MTSQFLRTADIRRPCTWATIGFLMASTMTQAESPGTWIRRIENVLDATTPLDEPETPTQPFYIWAAHVPDGVNDDDLERIAVALNARGIPLITTWKPNAFEQSLATATRVARLQKRLDLHGGINATPCLHAFFNGDPSTAHVDESGQPFFDESYGHRHKIGCPFTLSERLPVIREQVRRFVDAYRQSGLNVEFIFADWEIDGPLEFNRAHAAARRCVRCRRSIPDLGDFAAFQKVIRRMRADLQKKAFVEPVRRAFPNARVGNYAVYPHDGHRYWYDYFESFEEGQPHVSDQRARYRVWYPEFPETGYTVAMPVVYPWEEIFTWYDFAASDYRWFYNMLKVATNAGQHTPDGVPVVSFIHYHALPDEDELRPDTKQMSARAYQELLWHMLLRGTDALFVWCPADQAVEEVRLAHEVYRASQAYREILANGRPVLFEVPKESGAVISAVVREKQIILRRTDFDTDTRDLTVSIEGQSITVPSAPGRLQLHSLK